LPGDLPATIFAVVHVSADSPGMLPSILNQAETLPAAMAEDGAAILPGHIYVAPADHHLLLEHGHMRVTRGPKENRFRPAVDPLFRSAAQAYGPRVIGIVLSGLLDDGAAGLWAVKRQRGLAIVQEPTEAAYPSMPLAALKYVAVDYTLSTAEIGKLLPQLVRTEVEDEEAPTVPEPMEIETKIALEGNALDAGVMQLGPLSPYTCPECSGVLVQVRDGRLLRFRCHTGHAYSVESLLAAINESIEQTLWSTVRVLEEHMLLLRHLGEHAQERSDETLARRLQSKAQSAEDQIQIVRQLAVRQLTRDI
jgi:two-component system chemotaxis response regulator CheB